MAVPSGSSRLLGGEMPDAPCHTGFPLQSRLLADPMVQGVMLAGGVLQDAMLAKQSASSVRTVFAPKVGHPVQQDVVGAPLQADLSCSTVQY